MKEFEITSRSVEQAIEEVQSAHGLRLEEFSYEIIDPGSRGFLKFGSREAIIRVAIQNTYYARQVSTYIEKMLRYSSDLDSDLSVTTQTKDMKIIVQLQGEHLGRMIGKHGKTLSALQHLSNIFVNRLTDSKVTVLVEIGNYKERRKETLSKLALHCAKKVQSSGRRIQLDPMFAFERRIVHESIKGMQGIRSYSKGLEPYRFVVIEPNRKRSNQARKSRQRRKVETNETVHQEIH